jgi:hypothetical protein
MMMQAKRQAQYLARLDALVDLLRSRLGDRPMGWVHPPGLQNVWSDYASIREGLIADDEAHFGTLPECTAPSDAEREHCGHVENGQRVKSIPVLPLVNLRDAAEQARTLLLGGASQARLALQERAQLENENLRLKNWRLFLAVIAALLTLLAASLGYIAGGCATLRTLQQPRGTEHQPGAV